MKSIPTWSLGLSVVIGVLWLALTLLNRFMYGPEAAGAPWMAIVFIVVFGGMFVGRLVGRRRRPPMG